MEETTSSIILNPILTLPERLAYKIPYRSILEFELQKLLTISNLLTHINLPTELTEQTRLSQILHVWRTYGLPEKILPMNVNELIIHAIYLYDDNLWLRSNPVKFLNELVPAWTSYCNCVILEDLSKTLQSLNLGTIKPISLYTGSIVFPIPINYKPKIDYIDNPEIEENNVLPTEDIQVFWELVAGLSPNDLIYFKEIGPSFLNFIKLFQQMRMEWIKEGVEPQLKRRQNILRPVTNFNN